jgi:hypothetical protein
MRRVALAPNGPQCRTRCYHAAFALTNGKLEPQFG